MSCTMNGHAMSIGYGEAGTVSDTLAIGRNYCHRHLARIPQLSRQQLIRLGCVFPKDTPKLPSRPKKEHNTHERAKKTIGRGAYTFVSDIERAKIVELYADASGMKVNRIALDLGRTPTCIRNVLKAAGTYRHDPLYGVVRAKIIEAYRSGVPLREIPNRVGSCAEYVRTVLVNAGLLQRRKEAA